MRTNASLVYAIEEVDTIIDRVWNWKYLKAHQKITPKQVLGTGIRSWGDVRDYVNDRWFADMTPTGLKMRTNKLYQKISKFQREFVPDSDTVWCVKSYGGYHTIGYVVSPSKVGATNTAFTLYGWALAGTESTPSADTLSAECVGIGGWEEARKRNVDIASEIQVRITRYERELLNTQKQIESLRTRVSALLTVEGALDVALGSDESAPREDLAG